MTVSVKNADLKTIVLKSNVQICTLTGRKLLNTLARILPMTAMAHRVCRNRVEVEKTELLQTAIARLSKRDSLELYRLLCELGIAPDLFRRLTGHTLSAKSDNIILFP